MKILQINTVYGEGSTGKIARDLHDMSVAQGMRCLVGHRCVTPGKAPPEDSLEISGRWDSRVHGLLARYTMFKGCFSYLRTRSFLKKVDAFGPDLIHLHNLHGSYVNLPLLFRYIKKRKIPVVWTLHDCWPMTAICSHFTIARCDRWKEGCHHCPQRKKCSSCPVDLTKRVWRLKRGWSTGLPNAVLVTPSQWLAGLVRQSFLKEYPVITIPNGIDLSVFEPTPSDIRQRLGLTGKKIVLGVAFGWGYEKGLDVFVQLSQRLPEDYVIVLVGTDERVDATLPKNIVSIHRTTDQRELAQLYTAADVFVDPTREENYPTVMMEALACGTPVVAFDTGGCKEIIHEGCGVCVAVDDVDQLEQQILRFCAMDATQVCLRHAAQFHKDRRLGAYLPLYESMVQRADMQEGEAR